MRKIISIAFVVMMMLVPMVANAISSDPYGDVRIAKNGPDTNSVTASGFTGSVETTLRNSIAVLDQKISGLTSKNTETSNSVKALTGKKGALTKIGENVQGMRNDQKELDKKLTGKNGEFERTREKIASVDSALFKVAIWLTFVVLAVGLGTFFFLRRDVKIVGVKVDELPIVLSELEAPIKLENVAGFDIVYRAPLIDGKRRTMALQRVVEDSYVNPTDIPRGYATTVGKMKSSLIDTLTRDAAGEFDGTDARAILQKKVLAHVKRPGGELIMTPTTIP